ncbi:biopolymer transporter ExbD [Methylomonas sp. LWB]|uniref:MotA/TolQ/ExbB proton channel family protein n=1 Tax=Methylomonas sp. LWB TaxID=1905845 RepID=UPI0008D9D6E7|nr:MotA/TolQ/ExbB proton channel family protein [Methylomonas sp. LWB]OHX36884.1 biopolymer transporter ExbD [Methylomonas sp. LWB]
MSFLEVSLYEITKYFLTPVLLLIVAMFIFAFFALGVFLMELWQRLYAGRRGLAFPSSLDWYRRQKPGRSVEDLELYILKRLEPFRIVSRAAPMLGLVATMIPMGPALLSLSENNTRNVSENLVVAFSAVITALLAASITFVILTVRRRWLLTELHDLNREV